ncbi:CpsD/CapB family tyrosine-protein kinase [Parvularcula dongshanensis]|uniref:Mrp family chromosome partitioning ATPase n=1 Tax=Parvularcula dongshanensis TaxID=1173995 RepID=A0A840I0W5_9PROT|nr:CpsD/CapB family tyrosine-protein kinase [Parvularcula dongshanensis]MBB4657838.1 Mrp family chromosome partitioning ATPase [Parvularcula dongshanensis]
MREFEEALRRARAGVSDPLPTKDGPAVEPPVRQEYARRAEPQPSRPQVQALQPLHAPSAPSNTHVFPPLTADIAFFRESFGSQGGDSAVVDGAFRILRTRVLEAMKVKGGQVLGITSPAPGAGKTVTAIHLALACARRPEQTVILADFDYRRPAVAQYLDATGFKPSIDYFRGEGQALDYLYRNEAGNLLFMLTDRSTEMSAEHLASSRFAAALDSLRGVAEDALVILDLPPMTGCDDTLAVMPRLDGVLLVVAAGESRFSHLEETVAQIPKDKLIGTVLNKAEGAGAAYDYY